MIKEEAVLRLEILKDFSQNNELKNMHGAIDMAIEALERKHGEWIKTTIAEPCGTDELHMPIYRDRETVKCSKCGNPSPIYNIEFEFCPRCGAKMDGER